MIDGTTDETAPMFDTGHIREKEVAAAVPIESTGMRRRRMLRSISARTRRASGSDTISMKRRSVDTESCAAARNVGSPAVCTSSSDGAPATCAASAAPKVWTASSGGWMRSSVAVAALRFRVLSVVASSSEKLRSWRHSKERRPSVHSAHDASPPCAAAKSRTKDCTPREKFWDVGSSADVRSRGSARIGAPDRSVSSSRYASFSPRLCAGNAAS